MTNPSLVAFGTQKCSPSHSHGPAYRDYVLFHFVHSGRGFLKSANNTFHVEKNEIFVCFPYQIVYYQADEKNPWYYSWIGIRDSELESFLKNRNITKNNPVIDIEPQYLEIDELLKNLATKQVFTQGVFYERNALMYQFLSLIYNNLYGEETTSHQRPLFINEAKRYIDENYHHNIKVKDIANALNIDRSYLSHLFKNQENRNIQDYLIDYKLNKALKLVKETNYSIKEIAFAVGYIDPFTFSKAFKKQYNISPRNLRNKLK